MNINRMNRNVSAQISYDRLNKGVDIRNPSTAAFLVDSADRDSIQSASEFTITPPGQNLFTGFFTRFALTEIVLNWGICNISNDTGLRTFAFQWALTPISPANQVLSVSIPTGYYNVQQALDAMVVVMNAAVPGADPFSIANTPDFQGCKAIVASGTYVFNFLNFTDVNTLPNALGFPTFNNVNTTNLQTYFNCVNPNLSPYSYLDFTSPQLASQQDVKDSSTDVTTPDSIYRWIFADDTANTYDSYQYPILQCYRPFVQRRYLAFPKQIRWDPLIPLGQIQFRILTNGGVTLQYGYQDPNNVVNPLGTNPAGAEKYGQGFDWNMLMLVSEV